MEIERRRKPLTGEESQYKATHNANGKEQHHKEDIVK
jgi:hypothetical protein